MTLVEKLKTINRPPVVKVREGSFKPLECFWNDFIFPRLPKKETVLKWHEVLIEYVMSPKAMFACRFYNTASKERYNELRRGFLTQTDKGYFFFYTDNFHAAYYLKMALDDFVPSVEELIAAYNSRKFPARFGANTSEERKILAIPNGRNPGFTTAGYKIAHIHDVGRNYFFDGKNVSLTDIVEKYFPRGERNDWIEQKDSYGDYFVRNLSVAEEAKKFLVAEFLRFVHPFNYFLMPKMTGQRKNARWACLENRRDMAEYLPFLSFVQEKFTNIYGNAYKKFLDLIMADENYFAEYDSKILKDINLQILCETNFPQKNLVSETSKSKEFSSRVIPKIDVSFSDETKLKILREFLKNPRTSFRKIEMDIMKIESPVRGGGFKAKKIINDFGAIIEDKGILAVTSFDSAIKNIKSEKLKNFLIQNRNFFEN